MTTSPVNRRSFLAKGSVAVAATAAAASSFPAPAIAQTNPKINWNLASSFPRALDTIYGAAEVFAEAVSQATEGNFVVSPKAAGELVPAFEVRKAVTDGAVQMGHTASYYFIGDDETFAFDTAVPFGINARMMNAWQFEGGGLELIREFFATYNIMSFPMGNTGVQMGGWFRKEINSVADMKGVKMRIAGLGGRVVEAIGGLPQQIPGSEIYQSLEKGTIDAAEWVGPYDDEKLGFYKVAPFYYAPGWWEAGPVLSLYINMDQYNELPAHYKAIVEHAAHKAHTIMMARYDARNPAALKRLIAAGAQVRRYPLDVMQAAFDASQKMYEEIGARNATFKKIHDSLKPFQQDTYAWMSVAELSFDSFMTEALARR